MIDPASGGVEAIKYLSGLSGTIYVQDMSYYYYEGYGGVLYIVGNSDDFSSNNVNEIIVIRIDASLDSDAVKLRRIGYTTNLYGYSIEAAADGVYITGKTILNGGDVIAIKLDNLLDQVEWAIEYGSSDTSLDEQGEDIKYIDSYVYVVGETEVSGYGLDAFVMKLNPDSGSVEWSIRFGGIGNEFADSMVSDGSYLYVTGGTGSYGDRSRVYVSKIDVSTGGLEGFYVLGANDGTISWGSYITVAGDKLFVVGTTDSYGAGSNDHIVYELSASDGSVISAKTIGASSDDGTYCGTVLNSLIYVGGYSYIGGSKNPSVFLYSPAISTLEWTGGEGWEPLSVSEPSISSSIEAPDRSDWDPNVALLSVAVSEIKGPYLSDEVYSLHIAEDNAEPLPIPEPAWIIAVVSVLALSLAVIRIRR